MKIISGGQTGADEAGLSAALKMGFETGGHAPKTFNTVYGPNLELKTKYGLTEDSSIKYPPRTLKNVENSDCTIRLASNFKSPGEQLTLKYINRLDKPSFNVDILDPVNPRELALWIFRNDFKIINIAGNADRNGSTEIFEFVEHYLIGVFTFLKELKCAN